MWLCVGMFFSVLVFIVVWIIGVFCVCFGFVIISSVVSVIVCFIVFFCFFGGGGIGGVWW